MFCGGVHKISSVGASNPTSNSFKNKPRGLPAVLEERPDRPRILAKAALKTSLIPSPMPYELFLQTPAKEEECSVESTGRIQTHHVDGVAGFEAKEERNNVSNRRKKRKLRRYIPADHIRIKF
ncbi:hypothetical protein BTUL_0105g00010 [Botrytis tulipae]|uniref:Uncharacterized protein n=1 Tax=Botrytis tulipae TaxID=87230 RepID=A0A4Z1EQY4_9HELO|nr:hypothetical protein BTUL_0105g00010 [Botrytis tulipae]